MEINKLQLTVFLSGMILKYKSPEMELSRTLPAFRTKYKDARGLPRNATAETVLIDLGYLYAEAGIIDEFDRKLEKFGLKFDRENEKIVDIDKKIV